MKTILLTFFIFGATFFASAQNSPVHVGPRPNTADDPANAIYVSTTGNDATATGAIDKPYKSINRALEVAREGSTIVLRGGTYREKRDVRITKSNITIKSRKGEWAIIDLPYEDDPRSDKQSSTIYFYAENSVTGGNVKGCKLQHVEVKGGFYAVAFETMWDWGKPDRSGASDIIIEDCILHDSRNDVVKIKPNCDNITIRYCEIYNSGREHVSHPDFPTGQRNAEGIDNVNGDKMHVHNCYIHDICSNAVYAKGGATDALIENNLIKQTNGAGIAIGFDTSPDFFDLTVNPQYYENIRGVVRNNLVMDTGWEGIGLYASKDAEVYNNTLVNVAKLGMFARSAIYFGIVTQDWKSHPGRPANVNPNVHHNLVSQPAGIVYPMVEIRFDNNDQLGQLSGLSGNPTMNNNCYYIAGKSAAFTDNRPGSTLKNAGLAAWKSHIGGENGSIETNPSLNADYMPTNAQCAGMGIQNPFRINTPTGIEELLPPICNRWAVSINAGMVTVDSPAAETVQAYAINGVLLFDCPKPAGKVSFSIYQPKGAIIILKGSSGWTEKIVVQ